MSAVGAEPRDDIAGVLQAFARPSGVAVDCCERRHDQPAGDRPQRERVSPTELLKRYSPAGGAAHSEEIVFNLRSHQACQPISMLARWVVSRSTVSFSLRGELFFPRFQFDVSSGLLREGARSVVSELRDVYDDEEIANWFVRRNMWLGDRAPWELLDGDTNRVCAVARADRYVAHW